MTDRTELPEGQDSFKLNEVCKLAGVQPYMLRYWGEEFPELVASKSDTGQRTYSRDQVATILDVRKLLLDEGMTVPATRKRIKSTTKSAKKPPAKKAPTEKAAKSKPTGKKSAKDSTSEAKEVAKDVAAAEALTDTEIEAKIASEVDKKVAERVQPLLATLTELRSEVSDILADLRSDSQEPT